MATIEVDTDFMIQALEDEGYVVYHKDDDDLKTLEDAILNLKDDFINWYALGMKNENFEKIMKQFFVDTVGEYIQ